VIDDLSTHHAKYVTVPELAEYFGLKRHAFYYWIDKGAFPGAITVGRKVLVPVSEALAFAKNITPKDCHELSVSSLSNPAHSHS